MPPTLYNRILASNPKHLTANKFLINLAVSLNVVSIPLAIFLLILIMAAIVMFIVVVILIIRQYCRKRMIPVQKKRAVKSIYLDDICPDATSSFGILEYSIEYNVSNQILTVCVIQAMNLHNSLRQNPNAIDSYATVALSIKENETEKQFGERKQTDVKRHTANPSWVTFLKFPVSEKKLQKINIKFEVYDYDSIGQDISLGVLVVPLSELNIIDYAGNILERTGNLQRGRPKILGLGDACIGLSYYPSKQKLDVTVFEARQLLVEEGGAPVKGVGFRINLSVKKQTAEWHQTKIKKELINPYFNQRLSFHLNPEDAQEAFLKFSLRKSSGLLKRQHTIGHFIVGRVSTFTNGVKHWEEMMEDHSRMHVMWHVIDDKKDSNEV